MENRAHAISAGLFAIAMTLAAVFIFWWFSDRREPTRDLVLVSSGSVNGLNAQANVRYRGILAGKVASIDLDAADQRNVLVTVRIRADLPITLETRARLASQGLTGIGYIALDDSGEDPRPLEGVAGAPPRLKLARGTVEEMTEVAFKTLLRLQDMSERLAGVLDAENVGRIGRSLGHLESASRNLDKSLSALPQTLASVQKVFSPRNLERISRSLDKLEGLSGDARLVLKDVQGLVLKLQDLGETLDRVAGATGESLNSATLPRLNGLLQELTATSRQLSDILDEVDTTPQMLILGRGKTPPGPGEKGFPTPAGR